MAINGVARARTPQRAQTNHAKDAKPAEAKSKSKSNSKGKEKTDNARKANAAYAQRAESKPSAPRAEVKQVDMSLIGPWLNLKYSAPRPENASQLTHPDWDWNM